MHQCPCQVDVNGGCCHTSKRNCEASDFHRKEAVGSKGRLHERRHACKRKRSARGVICGYVERGGETTTVSDSDEKQFEEGVAQAFYDQARGAQEGEGEKKHAGQDRLEGD